MQPTCKVSFVDYASQQDCSAVAEQDLVLHAVQILPLPFPLPGTLQQAVVCEALSSTFIAPGLLYITRAHRTADFKMVSAISLFVVSSLTTLYKSVGPVQDPQLHAGSSAVQQLQQHHVCQQHSSSLLMQWHTPRATYVYSILRSTCSHLGTCPAVVTLRP